MKHLFLVLMLAVFTAGCAHRASNDPHTTFDKRVDSDVVVIESNGRLLETGYTQMRAIIFNDDSGGSEHIEYRVQWFDSEGYPIDSVKEISWEYIFLRPLEQRVITAVGPTPQAVIYKIYIQEAKRPS